MNVRSLIDEALRLSGVSAPIATVTPLSGGCIFSASRVVLEDDSTLVAKVGRGAGSVFEEESAGLCALAATRTVVVPRPLGVQTVGEHAVIIMSYIEPARATNLAWRRFGENLAELHTAKIHDRYGFDHDNHIGSTLQPNGWMADWVEFNRVRRIGHQVELASRRGLLSTQEQRVLEAVLGRLECLLPRTPHPALLHGDLWSGNALPTTRDRIAVIDPAVSVGDGWADIAMMKLFGGFPNACFETYVANQPDAEAVDKRVLVYQLYHVLNHVNIFGRGYSAQAIALARQLVG